MRSSAFSALFTLTALLFAAGSASAQSRHIDTPAEQRTDLNAISAYLNSVHTMTGGFLQVDPNGQVDQGQFYLRKPGRIRFEYRPPNPMLVVCDGHSIMVQNRQLKTTDRYPLLGSPLNLILGDHADLAHNPRIVSVHHENGTITVDAKTNAQALRPNVSIVFAAPSLELRQWTVIDPQGLATTVALRDIQSGTNLADALFSLNSGAPVRKTEE